MNELKHLFIAAVPSSPGFFVALESPSTLTIISSLILPIVFFILSKTVDVLVQIYFKRKQKNG